MINKKFLLLLTTGIVWGYYKGFPIASIQKTIYNFGWQHGKI